MSVITTLIILIINLWIVSLLYRQQQALEREKAWRNVSLFSEMPAIRGAIPNHKDIQNQIEGLLNKHIIGIKVAEKTADRAFNLASSANLGVVALQKALATPRIITREQSKLNQLAKNSVDELFTTQGGYDWLKPLLNDDDLELLEEIERKKLKEEMKQ